MSLPRYPEYKDSGVEWLGEVPAHWSIRPLKSAYRIVGGSTPKSDVAEYWDGDISWVTPADLSRLGGFDIRDSLRKITADGLQSCGSTLVPAGSIVLSTRAPIGSLGLAVSELCTNQGCKSLVPQAGQHSKFLAYLLSIAGAALNVRGKGTTFVELSADELGRFPVSLPSGSDQIEIAAFLDRETARIDALIAEQEKLLALLAEKRQATISHAVTRGLDPSVPMKDSGIAWLGEVPAHWQVRSLKSVVSTPITDGPHETPAFLDEGVAFVSAEAVSTGKIDFERVRGYISKEDDARYSQKYRPQLHDIYMVKSGATTGVCAIVDGRTDFNIWSPLAAIRCSEDVVLPYFVLNYLRSKNFQEGVALNWSYGTQQNIGMGVIGDLPVVVPPIAEQRSILERIDSQLSGLEDLQQAARHALPVLRERRSALISAAVTGQIDVRGLVGADAA
jgi:type I restriction enzyme S subunit